MTARTKPPTETSPAGAPTPQPEVRAKVKSLLADDGVMLWYLDTGGDVDATPAVSKDGTIYLAGDDGVVRAFR